MTQYEELIEELSGDGIDVIEFDFTNDNFHGLYVDGCIAINKNLSTCEKVLTAYEEWGHYKTSCGNILDQSTSANRRQEKRARRWAHDKFMPVERFIEKILEIQPTDVWELIDALDITYPYLCSLVEHYQQKFGSYKEFEGGCIWFDPIDIALYNME